MEATVTSRYARSPRTQFWLVVAGIVAVLFVVSVRIYHPGMLVEFSDTVYPLRPDLTLAHWMNWWSTGNLGQVWYQTCWLTNLVIPYLAWSLHVDPGIGEAALYFLWIAVPVIAVAFCIDRLSHGEAGWVSGAAVALLPFNAYVTAAWTSSVAMYALGAAALYAWALIEGIYCKRALSGLLVAAAASFWLAPDAANPPYFIIVLAHTAIFALWLLARKRAELPRGLRFCSAVLILSLLLGTRWLVPMAAFYAHPLSAAATGAGAQFDWVIGRAHLVNAMRFSPFWYWGDPNYTAYVVAYERNPVLILGTFMPFLAVLVALGQALRARARWAIGLFAIVFVWLFLIKSANDPFAGVSMAINKLPLMGLFRDSEKFSVALLIDLTIAVAWTLARIPIRRSVAALCGFAMAYGALAGGWALITGGMFNAPRGIPPVYVRIPAGYASLARDLAALPVHRVISTPLDEYYEVGTKWGFLGADTEFFDDLPDMPLIHNEMLGYVKQENTTALIAAFGWALWRDLPARTSVEKRVGLDAVVARNDAMPYVGFQTDSWRDGDLPEYAPRLASQNLGLYSAIRPGRLAYEVPVAAYASPITYVSSFADLLELGVDDLPLIAAPKKAPVEHAVELREFGAPEDSIDRRSPLSAFVFEPRGIRGGAFDASPGEFDVILRASSSTTQTFSLTSQATGGHAIPPEPAETILGGITQIQHDFGYSAVLGSDFAFTNEGPQAARARLQLPLLGRDEAACASVSVERLGVGTYLVPPGRSMLIVDAVVPPGPFTARVRFLAIHRCPPAALGGPAAWTAFAAPPSVLAPSIRATLRPVVARSFDVDVPLTQYPKVSMTYATPSPEPLTADALKLNPAATPTPVPAAVVVRARVQGAGCDATVAASHTAGSPLDLDVTESFDDIARRQFLSAACLKAPVTALRVTRVDSIVSANHDYELARPISLEVEPSRPAILWVPLAKSLRATLPEGTLDGARTEWPFGLGSIPLAQHPVFDFVGSSCDAVRMSLRATFDNGTVARFDLQPYVRISDVFAPAPYDPNPHATLPITSLAEAAGVPASAAVVSATIVAEAQRPLAQPCRLAVAGAWIGTDAPASLHTIVSLDGTRIDVPRDDLPHRYRVTLRGLHHHLGVSGTLDVGGVFASGLLGGDRSIDASASGVDAQVTTPGWLVYEQSAEPTWGATLDGSRLAMYRVDHALQAYYANAPGRVRVYFWYGALRPFAELVTWITLLSLVALWLTRSTVRRRSS